jgi:hypothetical protein
MTQLLQRLVVEYRGQEVVARVLYKTDDAARLGPNTKARTREVTDLAKSGLRDALEALGEGEATMCGSSGFTQREDLLSVALPRPYEAMDAERAS